MPNDTLIAELQQRYGIGDLVRFEVGEGGLTRIAVQTPHAQAHVHLHGAHVTHWQPRGHQPVLFMSKQSAFETGKPIRGGVPVCFPWFGPNEDKPEAPMHGTVRLKAWNIELVTQDHAGRIVIALTTVSDDASRKWWPHDFHLRHTITISDTLSMALESRNTGTKPFTITEALHTYFVVGDVRKVQVTGVERTKYFSKIRNAHQQQGEEPLTISGETDRVYHDTKSPCILSDPTMNRKITIDKAGSSSTVVWNPWIDKSAKMPDFGDHEWPGMLCIETANAMQNAVKVHPGATHLMRATISVS
ncbi:MAG: D-hexose-6-phosphate mutarotase [Phycisphaeraceae bacterium]|nr:D-hexose-6-phosphate mutarotase [Phycisphaeraceae bacterium]